MSNETPAANHAKTKLARNGLYKGRRVWRRIATAPKKLVYLIVLTGVFVAVFVLPGVFRAESKCPLWINDPSKIGMNKDSMDRCVSLEKVTTPAAQERGLSGRSSMPMSRGMLFAFRTPGTHCFWMKDMHFSLDMVWLDSHNKVIYIERNVAPSTYPKTFCPNVPAKYVIEVNAGVADAANIEIGKEINL